MRVMEPTEDHTHSSTDKRRPSPWWLWISLLVWIAISSTAFPYVDSSPKSVLAITGPLCVLVHVGVIIKFYWDRHHALSRGSTDI
jgi:hypothetical protein